MTVHCLFVFMDCFLYLHCGPGFFTLSPYQYSSLSLLAFHLSLRGLILVLVDLPSSPSTHHHQSARSTTFPFTIIVLDLPSPLSIHHHSVRSTITTLHLPSQRLVYHHRSPFIIALNLLSSLSIYHHSARSNITTIPKFREVSSKIFLLFDAGGSDFLGVVFVLLAPA